MTETLGHDARQGLWLVATEIALSPALRASRVDPSTVLRAD